MLGNNNHHNHSYKWLTFLEDPQGDRLLMFIVSAHLISLPSCIIQRWKLSLRDVDELILSPTAGELGFERSSHKSEICIFSSMVT